MKFHPLLLEEKQSFAESTTYIWWSDVKTELKNWNELDMILFTFRDLLLLLFFILPKF